MAAVSAFGASAASGWHVPAEDVRHEATFLMWPTSRAVYSDRWHLQEVQETIAALANLIADFEPVILLAEGALHGSLRRRMARGVTLWDIPTDDLWARDAGPLFLRNGAARAVSGLQFNGWGGKQPVPNDARVSRAVAARLGLPVLPSALKGEPGGVEQDGHGLLMAHESSWVIANRNPGQSRAAVERALLAAYGADRIIWAPGVKGMDITDYHIDSLARFTDPGRVLMTLPDRPDPRDPFHQAALQTHDILEAAGLDLEVIPEPIRRRNRDPEFVASYVNFYVCNGAVITAAFGDQETDAIAVEALARHFPGRAVVTMNADALGELGGGIHCATQQMPA